MSDKEESPLKPTLRFPDFRNANEWNQLALLNIATVLMGASPKSASYNEKHDGLPLLQGNADIKNRLSAPRVFTSEITKECQVEDILMSVRAPVGTVAKAVHHACIGRGIAAIRAREFNNQEFLYQRLLSYESKWVNISQGGTFDAINSDDLKGLNLSFPILKEQKKIADCLSSLDELIAAQARKVDALKTHKKGLMQQLFPREGENQPRFRFYDLNEASDWSERPFGDLLDDILDFRGRTPKKLGMEWGGGVIASLSANNVKNGFIDYSSECNVGSEELYEKWMGGVNLERGDIVFTMEAPLGKATLLPDSEKYILSQRVVAFKTCAEVSNEFLIQVIWSEEFQKGISQLATGSTAKGINQKALKTVRLKLPCSKEQGRIAGCLTSIDAFITAATKELKVLRTHKGGLMQQLFPSAEAGEA